MADESRVHICCIVWHNFNKVIKTLHHFQKACSTFHWYITFKNHGHKNIFKKIIQVNVLITNLKCEQQAQSSQTCVWCPRVLRSFKVAWLVFTRTQVLCVLGSEKQPYSPLIHLLLTSTDKTTDGVSLVITWHKAWESPEVFKQLTQPQGEETNLLARGVKEVPCFVSITMTNFNLQNGFRFVLQHNYQLVEFLY